MCKNEIFQFYPQTSIPIVCQCNFIRKHSPEDPKQNDQLIHHLSTHDGSQSQLSGWQTDFLRLSISQRWQGHSAHWKSLLSVTTYKFARATWIKVKLMEINQSTLSHSQLWNPLWLKRFFWPKQWVWAEGSVQFSRVYLGIFRIMGGLLLNSSDSHKILKEAQKNVC